MRCLIANLLLTLTSLAANAQTTTLPTSESAQIAACIATAHAKAATTVAELQPPSGFASPLKRLVADVRSGQLDEALTIANKLVAENPNDAILQAALGLVDYQRGKMADSVAAFNHAIQLDPCNARAHYFAWRFASLGGQPAAGLQQLELAHQLAPHDPIVQRTWAAVQLAQKLENSPNPPTVTTLNPPREGFFAKSVNCDGLFIQSSAAVDNTALILACGKVRTMLAFLPDTRRAMISHGSELHILGDHEGTTDLPENRHFKTEPYIDAEGKTTNMDQRTRGVGGLLASCGEENLLGLPNDRYGDGSDTCIHEFSHNIMENGFTQKQRNQIEKQYRDSLSKGLWKGAYAAVNVKEYWAELSMWYFGSHGNMVPGSLTTPGAEALHAYDPGAFALVDHLYSGGK